ncbi:SH3 domain-containing protein [Mesobacillus subterraneus]|uniref:SH3 domain-containing protein n=1 Tax=Mesobacillus subterraneus TaxID=285983 RepID=A0A427TE23_9BACI|nr:SH3 domain-containing protein [Mesobacillus subterraneus]RSD21089.1 SH3 domain-containing protein [Mesobacillus subterraneus]
MSVLYDEIFKGTLGSSIGIRSSLTKHVEFASANEVAPVNCSITIESDKHQKQNFAEATGDCKGQVYGYYSPAVNTFHIMGAASYVVKDGQTLELELSRRSAILTVKTVLKSPKPAPKPAIQAPKVLYKGTVTSKTLNIREKASSKAKKIGTLKKNVTVEVVASSNGWSKIKHGKGYGWVSTKYVKKIKTEKVLFKSKVKSQTLNVRKSPSIKATKLGKLKKDQKIEVVESSEGWYKIKYGKSYGYVSSKYTTKIK